MSMISGLIDELNKSADEWNSSNMFELARMCREAADTIWQLRDDLQRANAENVKLRELVRDYERCTMHADCTSNCLRIQMEVCVMESSTKILRRLLDERGVEWWQKKRHTCWKVSKGQEVEMWRAWEAPDGSITLKVDYIYGLTPEQAIAATLGTGTCREVMINRHWRGCSECGHVWENMYGEGFQKGPNYCPECGRRIEQ